MNFLDVVLRNCHISHHSPKSLTREQRHHANKRTNARCVFIMLKIDGHTGIERSYWLNKPSTTRLSRSLSFCSLKIVCNRKLLSDRRIFIITTFDPRHKGNWFPRLAVVFSISRNFHSALRTEYYFANSHVRINSTIRIIRNIWII